MLPARQSSSLLLHHSSLVNFISNRAETDTLSRIFTNTYAGTAACFFLLFSCDLLKSSSEKRICYLRPPAVDWPSKIISNCTTKKGYATPIELFFKINPLRILCPRYILLVVSMYLITCIDRTRFLSLSHRPKVGTAGLQSTFRFMVFLGR